CRRAPPMRAEDSLHDSIRFKNASANIVSPTAGCAHDQTQKSAAVVLPNARKPLLLQSACPPRTPKSIEFCIEKSTSTPSAKNRAIQHVNFCPGFATSYNGLVASATSSRPAPRITSASRAAPNIQPHQREPIRRTPVPAPSLSPNPT